MDISRNCCSLYLGGYVGSNNSVEPVGITFGIQGNGKVLSPGITAARPRCYDSLIAAFLVEYHQGTCGIAPRISGIFDFIVEDLP